MDRREFLKTAGAGMASLAASPVFGQTSPPQRALTTQRVYAASKFALELDNAQAGWIFSADGGSATSDVVVEKLGPDRILHKHLAGVKYEDIELEFGTGMSKALYGWIKATLDRKYERHNGAIVSATFDNREMSRMTFNQALIREIGFPALDAASKDAAKMRIQISPEITRYVRSSGATTTAAKFPISAQIQKRWLPANFRLKIEGLDEACARVNKIDAITIKQKVAESSIGEQRVYQKEPGSLEIPNLVITVPEAYADGFYKWHEDFVIRGMNGQDKERGGTLEYLTPTLTEVLFKLTFSGLGIFKLAPEKAEAGAENIRRVKAEMYCEDIRFDFPTAAIG